MAGIHSPHSPLPAHTYSGPVMKVARLRSASWSENLLANENLLKASLAEIELVPVTGGA